MYKHKTAQIVDLLAVHVSEYSFDENSKISLNSSGKRWKRSGAAAGVAEVSALRKSRALPFD